MKELVVKMWADDGAYTIMDRGDIGGTKMRGHCLPQTSMVGEVAVARTRIECHAEKTALRRSVSPSNCSGAPLQLKLQKSISQGREKGGK